MPQSPQLSALSILPLQGMLMAQGPARQSSLMSGQSFQQFLDDAFTPSADPPPVEQDPPARETRETASDQDETEDPAAETMPTDQPREVATEEDPALTDPALLAMLMGQLPVVQSQNVQAPNLLAQETANPQNLAAMMAPQPALMPTEDVVAQQQAMTPLLQGDVNALQVQKLAQTPTMAPMQNGNNGTFTSRFGELAAPVPVENMPVDAMLRNRIMVLTPDTVISPAAGQQSPSLPGELPQHLPLQLASQPVVQDPVFVTSIQPEVLPLPMDGGSNGFVNSFFTSGSLLAGTSLVGHNNATTASTSHTDASQRPVLTSSLTEFPDVVASELGRTRIVTRPNQTEQIRIQLEPMDLGELDMQVRVDHDRTVHMMITTASENTRDLLHQKMDLLRESLAGQNLSFGDVRVEVQDRSGRQQEAWRQNRGRNAAAGNASSSSSDSRPIAAASRPSQRWLPGGGLSIHA